MVKFGPVGPIFVKKELVMLRRRLATLALLAGLGCASGCCCRPACPLFPRLRAWLDSHCCACASPAGAVACCDGGEGPMLDPGCVPYLPAPTASGPITAVPPPGAVATPQPLPQTAPPPLSPAPPSNGQRPMSRTLPYTPAP